MTPARGGPRHPHIGLVTEFDDARGLGTVDADDGGRYLFHCAAVADGSRFVAPGTRVAFCVTAGHGGRYEARHVARLDAVAPGVEAQPVAPGAPPASGPVWPAPPPKSPAPPPPPSGPLI